METITVWVLSFAVANSSMYTSFHIDVSSPTQFVTQQACEEHGIRLKRLVRDVRSGVNFQYICSKKEIVTNK